MKLEYNFNQKRIGFMQGRLLNRINKQIQYFPDKNWQKEIEIAKFNNFNLMEWTINYENIKNNPLYNGDLKDLKSILKNKKFRIQTVTCDFFMQRPFFKEKKKPKVKRYISDLLKVINNCSKLKFKYIVLPLVDNSSIKDKNEEKLLIDGLKRMIIPKLKKLKILFEIDYNPKLILPFIKKFNSKKIGINYDTGNSAGLNYDFNDEVKYFKYVKNIHIKDRKKFGTTVRLGRGNWKYKTFFKKMKKLDYKGFFILQTARSKNNNHLQELSLNKNFFLDRI